jgi:CubicO group peptidase (beta-lactamase class C family)
MNPHKLRVLLWAIGLPLLGQQAESAAATKPGKPSVAEHSLEDLADLLAPIRKQHNMPALGAAVIVDGKLVALGVDGVRKLGDATLVTRDDLWHLGSCTKAMTATLLAQQVALGKLSFATTVGEALPKLRAGMHAESRQITIEQLLQHRSGLPSQPPTAQWLELFDFEGTTIEARREVAATMLAKPPEAKPGERFLYSNAGYMIAGAVLEAVTGKSWQELLQADLFVPLAMQHVGFGPPGRDGHVDQPWGHVTGKRGSVAMFADNPPALGPAGTVHASLSDWAKFVALHLGVAAQQASPLLGTKMLRALHTPPTGADYALGWVATTRAWAPGPILWHNGSNTMWYAVTWLAPEAKFAVLVTCNHGDGSKACDDAAAACIRRFRR